MIDLEDDRHSYFGWPVVLLKDGAYLFDRGSSNAYQNLLQKPGSLDYSFKGRSEAKRVFESDFLGYDQLGELCDIPSWDSNSIVSAGLKPGTDVNAIVEDEKNKRI